jgi:hypothetical protein
MKQWFFIFWECTSPVTFMYRPRVSLVNHVGTLSKFAATSTLKNSFPNSLFSRKAPAKNISNDLWKLSAQSLELVGIN